MRAPCIQFLRNGVEEKVELHHSNKQAQLGELKERGKKSEEEAEYMGCEGLTASFCPKQPRKPNENGIYGPALASNDPSGLSQRSGLNNCTSDDDQYPVFL